MICLFHGKVETENASVPRLALDCDASEKPDGSASWRKGNPETLEGNLWGAFRAERVYANDQRPSEVLARQARLAYLIFRMRTANSIVPMRISTILILRVINRTTPFAS